MSLFTKVGSDLKAVGKEALVVGEEVAPVAAGAAGTAFLGPNGGSFVENLVSGLLSHASTTNVAPNTDLLKSSIGQVVEGVIGVLQALGKFPGGVAVSTTTTTVAKTTTTAPAPAVAIPNIPVPAVPQVPTAIGQ